jgi:hypothetical protein
MNEDTKNIIRFRDGLWDLARKNAHGSKPEEVVTALQQISDELWDLGLDSVYETMPDFTSEALGNAFDFCWLTAFCLRLKQKSLREPKQ